MMKPAVVLILDYNDGSVGRMQLFGESTDAAIKAAIGKMPKQPTGWRKSSLSAFPQESTFRNAWQHDGAGGIAVSMEKAREIQRDRMRQARTPILAALDVDAMRALEAKDSAAVDRVTAKKQALRDVTDTPAIDAAKTPEELKAVWPDILKK